jgi:C1A family cysteine protease
MFKALALFSLALVKYNNKSNTDSSVCIYPTFGEWSELNAKVYEPTERDYRNSVYDANVMKVDKHNLGNHTWTMGINKFADLTADEFSAHFTGRIVSPPRRSLRSTAKSSLAPLNTTALPTSVDWSAKGAVTPIKNQEQCGSCWAFSTTGSVEGAWFLAKGELVSLSEQQLMDCSGPEGNQGCNGGLMDYAFEYIIKNKGITTEAAYPYTAADGTCQSAGKPVAATLSGYKDVSPNSETALLTAIAQQPVSVAVEADQSVFQFYNGGVMDSTCGTALDHGVLAVGYGTDTGKDYYKVKNSWGADWGEKGYIRLGRGAKFNPSGQCGIQMDPSYPVV